MRFENSAPEMLRIDPVDLDDFRRSGEAADYAHGACGDAGQFGKEADNRLVRFASHRRRGNMQLPGVRVHTGEFGLASAGTHLKRESGFHSFLLPALPCSC